MKNVLIVGAGLAGLTAGRVLADAWQQITLMAFVVIVDFK
jgi:flavin-dependent dehydrogenase